VGHTVNCTFITPHMISAVMFFWVGENIFNTLHPYPNALARAEFPPGIKIQEKKGAGNLQSLLSKLKKYTFNGYLAITVEDQLEGYITLKDGMPRNALLYTPSDKEINGMPALQKIQGLESMDKLKIEVHTNVDIDSLIASTKGKLASKQIGEDYYQQVEQDELLEVIEEEIEEEEKEDHRKEMEKAMEKKDLEDELQRRIIEHEMKESEIEEKEIGVYDMVIKERKGMSPERPAPFLEKYSYENFVVGPNNKFAYAAAREVSRLPGDTFNPLFITSPSGLGKTHLLKAIGRYITKNHPELAVEYTTTAKFSKMSTEGKFNQVRDELMEVDVLLLDDIQFLANKPELQEDIYFIFNGIMERRGQIVLACDRAPEEIPSLQDRLVSRFKSGLVVDMRPPNFETRCDIISKKIEQYGENVPHDIIEFIAENIDSNVREIEGTLNRILAFSSLLKKDITMDVVRETLGETDSSPRQREGSAFSFLPGRSYLIEENKVPRGFKILKGLSVEKPIYVFSRMNPQRIHQDYGLEEVTIYWLTSRDSEKFETLSPNLESLTWHIEELLKEEPVILLDGIEYLIGQTGFDASIQFVRHVVDIVSEKGSIFFLTVSPPALERKQVSILEREMEVVPDG